MWFVKQRPQATEDSDGGGGSMAMCSQSKEVTVSADHRNIRKVLAMAGVHKRAALITLQLEGFYKTVKSSKCIQLGTKTGDRDCHHYPRM